MLCFPNLFSAKFMVGRVPPTHRLPKRTTALGEIDLCPIGDSYLCPIGRNDLCPIGDPKKWKLYIHVKR